MLETGSSPYQSPGGGIGRRARFRCEWFCDRAGSSPVLGTLKADNQYDCLLFLYMHTGKALK